MITLDYSWPGTFNKKDLHIQILLNPQLNPDNKAFWQERVFVNPNKANKWVWIFFFKDLFMKYIMVKN